MNRHDILLKITTESESVSDTDLLQHLACVRRVLRTSEEQIMRTQMYHALLLATLWRRKLQKAKQETQQGVVRTSCEQVKELGNLGISMTEFQGLFHDAMNVAREIQGLELGSDVGGDFFRDWDSQASSVIGSPAGV
jgi:hypothetical protein